MSEAEGLHTYQQVVAGYNKNLQRVDRLWARAVVELNWHDEKGKHFEQGDGNLVVVLPDRLALSIGKLGHTLMWAGCNQNRYWLFDLRDEKVAYVGKWVDTSDNPTAPTRELPIPIHPAELIQLLGIVAIDPQTAPAWPQVERYQDGYLIEPPGTRSRVLIDPQTYRPIRVDLLDEAGQSRIIGRLSDWEPMEVEGVSSGSYPWVATRLEAQLVGQDGTMILYLSQPSDGRAGDRIHEKAFDLDRLEKAFKPERYVDLNSGH